MAWGVIYINEKLLKCRYLKWARIAHLDIWNTSYDQKKGRESNWQFDSRPLKVGNRPDFRACRQSATYHWKALDKGYNFALDLILIRGLHAKLWRPKVIRVPTLAISGLPFGSPGTKSYLDVGPVERCRIYFKGEGDGFPQVWAVVSLVCLCCPWLVLAPKVLQLCIKHLVLILCKSVWVSEACQLFLVPSRSSNMTLYPSKVLWAKERASTPYSSVVLCLGLTFESLKELGVRHSKMIPFKLNHNLICFGYGSLFKGLGTIIKLLTNMIVWFHWTLLLGPLFKVALNMFLPIKNLKLNGLASNVED
jgi:hypothetical protein